MKWAQCDKPNPENCKNCSSKCAYDCTASVHNTTQNSSDNLPSYLQTTAAGKIYNIFIKAKQASVKDSISSGNKNKNDHNYTQDNIPGADE